MAEFPSEMMAEMKTEGFFRAEREGQPKCDGHHSVQSHRYLPIGMPPQILDDLEASFSLETHGRKVPWILRTPPLCSCTVCHLYLHDDCFYPKRSHCCRWD